VGRVRALLVLTALLLVAVPAGASTSIRPAVVAKPIPFGAKRRAETAAYAKRHYGTPTWRLVHPRVLVEHFTANESFRGTWNAFASDAADPELHELPGDCAHFVIDKDGTIYQLVPLSVICRHTVGLNSTAIGVEAVGTSDAEILHNPRQLNASLRLAAWIMKMYGIALGDVIGHNESVTSPYHHELYAAWRCQTHGDWSRADMDVYRAKLARLATSEGVPLGKRVDRVSPTC
jgi:N-acetylmuramoyl-L-alanine amidase